MSNSTDYTVPCHKSKIHPDGVCRKKLHKNIGNGFHRLVERMDNEAMEAQLEQQKAQFDEQRKHLDLQERMLGVGMGTHRVIKDMRKNKPKVDPFIPGGNAGKSNKPDNGKKQ
jgi:hypothetical protein